MFRKDEDRKVSIGFIKMEVNRVKRSDILEWVEESIVE